MSQRTMNNAQQILNEIGEILLRNNAALFMKHPATLWINGKEFGKIVHDDHGCGHEFIIKPAHQSERKIRRAKQAKDQNEPRQGKK